MVKAAVGGYPRVFTNRFEPVAQVTLYLADKNTFGKKFGAA